MKKYILHPATFKLDGGAMFGIIPKPLWSKKITPDEFNRINMSLRVVYLETKNKKILIDTGIGDYHPEKFNEQFDVKGPGNPLATALATKNIKPDQITDIIITHLHFDHVGGLGGKDGELIFKNAKLHLHKDHYEYALAPTLRDKGSFQDHYFSPLIVKYKKLDQLHFHQGNEGIILQDETDQVSFKTSFGHTHHMMHPIFDNYIYMADLVPMSHHINIPWVMGYDIEPGVTTVYKQKFYDYIMQNNLRMVFEHDIEIWGGTLGIDEKKRFVLQESFKSSQESIEELD